MSKLSKQIFCIILTLLLVFPTACGSEENLVETFETLVASDYEVYYLCYTMGLPTDSAQTVEQNGTTYQLVSSMDYQSLADLQKLLDDTYQPGVASDYLNRTDSNGNPIFLEQDGKLYQSTSAEIFMLPYEMIEGTTTLEQELGDTAFFSFEETGWDGSLYQTTMSMSKNEQGRWRLDSPRIDASRTVIREGAADDIIASGSTARQVAEEFLNALSGADTSEIERLSGASNGTYQSWSGIQVSNAAIVNTIEDLNVYGSYEVAMQVADGAGILEEGNVRYRMIVSYPDFGDSMTVQYLKPMSVDPYNLRPQEERTSTAHEMIIQYLMAFGSGLYESTADLPVDWVAEYCLIQLTNEIGYEQSYFTGEQLQAKALSCFGIENFDASGTPFYTPDGYVAFGRGGYSLNYLIFDGVEEDGDLLIPVTIYSDPLQTHEELNITYRMRQNADGSYRFVSATS